MIADDQLAFPTKDYQEKVDLVQQDIRHAFAFSNTGSKPVTILQVSSECGCLVPTIDKKTYLPGESGALSATLTIGGKTGVQAVPIYLATCEEGGDIRHDITLRMIADIPKLYDVGQSIFVWHIDDVPTSITTPIRMLGDDPIHVLGVEHPGTFFDIAISTIKDGMEYMITVTPKTGATHSLCTEELYILLDTPLVRYQKVRITAGVLKLHWSLSQ